jgi:hypothetical protein
MVRLGRPRPTPRVRSRSSLAVERNRISAITWFADPSVLPQFGLPRMLR